MPRFALHDSWSLCDVLGRTLLVGAGVEHRVEAGGGVGGGGFAQRRGGLVLVRIGQGAGGAALRSKAQATIRQIFPRDQQGLVQAIFLMGIIVAPTLGPTLGGWITDNYTWNWCFFINIPIGIVSAFLVFTFLKDPPGDVRRTGPVDFMGIGLLAVGVSSMQSVREQGEQSDGFNDPLIARLAILS